MPREAGSGFAGKIKIKVKSSPKQKIKIHPHTNYQQFLDARQNAQVQLKNRLSSNFITKLVWG